MNGRVILVSAVGGASGSKAAAAALACAGSEPDRPGLLIDVGARAPRPTLVSSNGACELEERLVAHLPRLRAASRGQTCHLAIDDDPSSFDAVRAALPLVREAVAVVHLSPARLRDGLGEPASAPPASCCAPTSTPTGRWRPSRSATCSTVDFAWRSSSGRSHGSPPGGRCSARCRPRLRVACQLSCADPSWKAKLQRRTRATLDTMTRRLTQRELRNNSGEVMRALDSGEDFIVTRNGKPVGELRPASGVSLWQSSW